VKGIKSVFGIITLVLMLSSCGTDDDLIAFVDAVNKRPPGPIEPLPQFKLVENYVYSSGVLRSPFQPPTIDFTKVGKGNGPDVTRPKEPLESYPLDSLRLVGAIQKKGVLWALIVDKTGLVHHLTVGHYLGQNYGKINKILENKIELTEMIVDNQGRWEARPTTMNVLQ
jgi:type IV pilus assembly protein PilP